MSHITNCESVIFILRLFDSFVGVVISYPHSLIILNIMFHALMGRFQLELLMNVGMISRHRQTNQIILI